MPPCAACGHPTEEGQRFCRACGSELAAFPGLAHPEAGAAPEERTARPANLPAAVFRILLAVLVISSLASWLARPSFVRSKAAPQKRACVSNLKLLEAAVQLYLLERKDPRDVHPDLKTLTAEGYLRAMPTCPASGMYSIRLTPARPAGDGRPGFAIDVRCSIHGGIGDAASGL